MVKKIHRTPEFKERGAALILALVALCILAFVGASFSLMVRSEKNSVYANILSQKALYAAESGISDILYHRSKKPDAICFPYYFDDDDLDQEATLSEIENMTGARSGGIDTAPNGTCDPDVDSIPEDVAVQELPCWPYNERLDPLITPQFSMTNDGFKCNDGSNETVCPEYDPLLFWPAKDDGTIGWKDVDPTIDAPLEDPADSSGARFTTGFFTQCNDDFEGVQPTDPGYDDACLQAKAGGVCPQNVYKFAVVSIGEVQMGKKTVRRAVKVDMTSPALYSGVIDKYVDVTLMFQTNINGPLHVNGWWNGNRWNAFLISLSLSTAPIIMWLDPPELVSVSYPEDPDNPDWQPSDLLGGFNISHDIVYIHLPIEIEIPQVNWNKWEERMQELYNDADTDYGDENNVLELYRCKFKKADPPFNDSKDYWITDGDCGDSGEQYPYSSGGNRSDDKLDAGLPKFMSSMSPNPTPYNTGAERIHNLERYKSDAQVWGSKQTAPHIFDLFDHWGYFGTDWVQGKEDADSVAYVDTVDVSGTAYDTGHRDRSFRYKRRFILEPDFGLGCLTCVIGEGINLDGFMYCCIGKELNRNEFWFMGKHEFRDFVYIDGIIGIGYRTPYHTCGGGDGGLGVYCVVIPEICLFWPLDWLCIPSWKFGLPHWHLGSGVITGELLVNGRLYLADWIHIDGGTIYADDHVIKDETSGFDVILHLDTLICWILTGFMGPSITIDLGVFGELNICDIVFAVLNPIITALVPWWPTIDLTNNGLLDFETYMDIDGIGPQMDDVMSPGTLYTRGDFRLMKPGWDVISFLGNSLLGMFLPFLELTPAMDPIRIYNGGALVAGGRDNGQGAPIRYSHGNIYLDDHNRADIMTSTPDGDKSVGYALARGGLRVGGDIISGYGWGGILDSCSPWSGNGLSEDCAAAGIFYSGGISAGTNPRNMYSRKGLSVGVNKDRYDQEVSLTCLPEDDGFWEDPLGQGGCWLNAVLDILGGDAVEHNIRGHVFAGKVGSMPGVHFRLDQDSSVRHDAVVRQYFKQLGGTPINWMEVQAPENLPGIGD